MGAVLLDSTGLNCAGVVKEEPLNKLNIPPSETKS